ncbi:MAG: HK97 family phage prohead protease [Desulfobacteraceae bacterium]|jgi:hypothetical protein
MPYPNEHTARIEKPSEFINDSFRRKNIARGIVLVLARRENKPDEMIKQAYRFNVRYFSAAQSLDWLKDNEVEYLSFEPAKELNEDNNKFDDDDLRIQADLKNEFRYIIDEQCLFREDSSGEQLQSYVDGKGIVYNSITELYPGVFESIEPGAFSESLSNYRTIKSFINHNPTKILSTTRSDPQLELLDGNNFLEFRAPIPPTTYGKDLKVNLKRGNINGASFSFHVNVDGDRYRKLPDGSLHRSIFSAELFEVGPVTNPAYEQTEVVLRNKDFFNQVHSILDKRNNDDNELISIKEFLQKRKGL